MSEVIMQLEDVRQFSSFLSAFREQLQGDMERIRGQLGALGESYRDQSYHHFVSEYEQAAQTLSRFLDEVDRFTRFLDLKADKGQDVVDIPL